MTAELHRLTRAGPILGGTPEDVVALLREMLAEAERGEIKGVALTFVDGSDTLVSRWASGCADRHLMVAGVSLLQAEVIDAARSG